MRWIHERPANDAQERFIQVPPVVASHAVERMNLTDHFQTKSPDQRMDVVVIFKPHAHYPSIHPSSIKKMPKAMSHLRNL
jgi:hypothetical protein